MTRRKFSREFKAEAARLAADRGHQAPRALEVRRPSRVGNLEKVDWFSDARLHSAIGYTMTNEAAEIFCASLNAAEKVAQSLNYKLSGKPRAVHRSTALFFSSLFNHPSGHR